MSFILAVFDFLEAPISFTNLFLSSVPPVCNSTPQSVAVCLWLPYLYPLVMQVICHFCFSLTQHNKLNWVFKVLAEFQPFPVGNLASVARISLLSESVKLNLGLFSLIEKSFGPLF